MVTDSIVQQNGEQETTERLYQLFLEMLDDRLAPADIRFINPAGGDWNVAGNWDLGRLPAAADDAIIDIAEITVTHLTGTHSVRSVNSISNFNISGGTLQASDNFSTTKLPLHPHFSIHKILDS